MTNMVRLKWIVAVGALIAIVVVALRRASESLVPSSIDTGQFDGSYELDTLAYMAQQADLARELERELDRYDDSTRARKVEAMIKGTQRGRREFAGFRIKHGVIRSGTEPVVMEFSFLEAVRDADSLRGKAIWHEDTNDPGDYSEEILTLRLRADTLEFIMHDDSGKAGASIRLIRRKP